mmetsp:Transcript_5776/g.8816  ORF Transcript_5776/g.8816 Transcript_5776/m.8816 type:complete len:102 (+) Transcript_5776:158-463(+)
MEWTAAKPSGNLSNDSDGSSARWETGARLLHGIHRLRDLKEPPAAFAPIAFKASLSDTARYPGSECNGIARGVNRPAEIRAEPAALMIDPNAEPPAFGSVS